LGDERVQMGGSGGNGGGFYSGLEEGSAIKLVDDVTLSRARR